MAYQQRKIPFAGAIDSNPETKPFFEGCAAGVLKVPHCAGCGKAHWYPRGVCPHCMSQNLSWRDASGQGTIYSFSVMKRAEVPYCIAYVTLAEGPTMLTNIVECDLDTVRIGQKVALRFVPTEGGPPLPFFTPA